MRGSPLLEDKDGSFNCVICGREMRDKVTRVSKGRAKTDTESIVPSSHLKVSPRHCDVSKEHNFLVLARFALLQLVSATTHTAHIVHLGVEDRA